MRIMIGGILGLAVAMGIGRFAFTPIIPYMEAQAGLDHFHAGQIASSNYLGYLLGALFAGYLLARVNFRTVYATALIRSSVSTCVMACAYTTFWWGVFRFVGGMSSSVILVSIAARITTQLHLNGRSGQGAILFSGVGVGIAGAGAVIPLFNTVGGWQGSWIGVGLCGFVLSLASLYLVKNVRNDVHLACPAAINMASTGNKLLIGAYFLEGLGYIVMATFLVTIVKEAPGLAAYSSPSWIIVGLSAAVSPVVWQMISGVIGTRQALTMAYFIQALGMYAGIYLTGLTGVLITAITFGGTFMGITSLTLAEGTRRGAATQTNFVAVLTFAYAFGQIIGPPCAGWLAQVSDGFGLTLKIAAGCVLLGSVLSSLDFPRKLECLTTGEAMRVADECED